MRYLFQLSYSNNHMAINQVKSQLQEADCSTREMRVMGYGGVCPTPQRGLQNPL